MKINIIEKVSYHNLRSLFKAWFFMEPHKNGSIWHQKGFCYCYKPKKKLIWYCLQPFFLRVQLVMYENVSVKIIKSFT